MGKVITILVLALAVILPTAVAADDTPAGTSPDVTANSSANTTADQDTNATSDDSADAASDSSADAEADDSEDTAADTSTDTETEDSEDSTEESSDESTEDTTESATSNGASACNSCVTCDVPIRVDPCPETGTDNWISGTAYFDNVDKEDEPPLYTWGTYPRSWTTSGRVHFSREFFSRNRFELRWQDANNETGRGWTRLSVYPVTIEGNAWDYDGYAWDHYQDTPALQFQERYARDVTLRIHKGELDNMVLRYEGGQYKREPGGARLTDYEFRRLTYQYNFDLAGGDIRGQVRQTATSSKRPRSGPGDYLTDTSRLKLDAKLSDEWSAYGRGSYTSYDYEDLPDSEFNGNDYKVGLRYSPDAEWKFDVSYGAKDYPVDNVISSHVDQSHNYGVAVDYSPCGGNWYQVGYRHTSFDYTQLNVQDSTLKPMLRSGASLTPGDITNYITAWTPEKDEFYASGTHHFSDKLTGTGRVSYVTGDMPGTDLVDAGSANLLYDQQVTGLGTLTYDADRRNQFALSGYNQAAKNGDRDGTFSMQYVEGSWTRCVVDNGFLTLGLRRTNLDLSTMFVEDPYTTDDTSYMLNFAHELERFSYGVDFTYTNGSGVDPYDQTKAGMDVKLKDFGPIGLRVDWFDRNYAGIPEFDSQALEVGVTYKIKF